MCKVLIVYSPFIAVFENKKLLSEPRPLSFAATLTNHDAALFILISGVSHFLISINDQKTTVSKYTYYTYLSV